MKTRKFRCIRDAIRQARGWLGRKLSRHFGVKRQNNSNQDGHQGQDDALDLSSCEVGEQPKYGIFPGARNTNATRPDGDTMAIIDAICAVAVAVPTSEASAAARRVAFVIATVANSIAAAPTTGVQPETMAAAMISGLTNLLDTAAIAPPEMAQEEWGSYFIRSILANIRETVDAIPAADFRVPWSILYDLYHIVYRILLVTPAPLAQEVCAAISEAVKHIANAVASAPPASRQAVAKRYGSCILCIADDVGKRVATIAALVFPERLVIYHAGTGRTTFLACLKLTTIFVFCFFTIVVTPAYISANEPLKAAGEVAACGTIPLLIVGYFTSPFVAWVHLRLPPYARHSREVLQRFARTMPPNTRLQVTTVGAIGKPRVSDMTVADLRPARARLGVVNYVRDTALADAARPWWMFRAVGRFSIQPDTAAAGHAKEGWVWKEVAEGIARRHEQQQQQQQQAKGR